MNSFQNLLFNAADFYASMPKVSKIPSITRFVLLRRQQKNVIALFSDNVSLVRITADRDSETDALTLGTDYLLPDCEMPGTPFFAATLKGFKDQRKLACLTLEPFVVLDQGMRRVTFEATAPSEDERLLVDKVKRSEKSLLEQDLKSTVSRNSVQAFWLAKFFDWSERLNPGAVFETTTTKSGLFLQTRISASAQITAFLLPYR